MQAAWLLSCAALVLQENAVRFLCDWCAFSCVIGALFALHGACGCDKIILSWVKMPNRKLE